MASNKDYLEYILDLFKDINGITYKKMMGEYLLYKDNILFGGIYDIRFLIKKTKSLINCPFKEQIPYPHASPMLLVETEDPNEIKELIQKVEEDLKK